MTERCLSQWLERQVVPPLTFLSHIVAMDGRYERMYYITPMLLWLIFSSQPNQYPSQIPLPHERPHELYMQTAFIPATFLHHRLAPNPDWWYLVMASMRRITRHFPPSHNSIKLTCSNQPVTQSLFLIPVNGGKETVIAHCHFYSTAI